MSDQAPPDPRTPLHEHLALFEGRWKAEVDLYFGPGAEANPMTGIMDTKLICNGLFAQQTYTGDQEFMGRKFSGSGLFGYNGSADRWEGVWIDTASSAMQIGLGWMTEPGRRWEMSGTLTVPGGAMRKRTLVTVNEDGSHGMEIFFTPPGGEEFRSVDARYTRV